MNPTSRTFRVGDRVVAKFHDRPITGTVARVTAGSKYPYDVRVLSPQLIEAFAASELAPVVRMSAPARALLAAWHASDRTLQRIDRPNSSNRANINWGRAIRRYLSPDGSIDLTIAVEVK